MRVFRIGDDFRWQHGYGAFSVTPSDDGNLRDYIRNQESHHRENPFAREYLSLLVRHGVYDPTKVLD